MKVCRIDPTADPRWSEFVDTHPDASIFHTVEWMEALRRTYGYEPIAYIGVGSAGQLINGIPFCRINSFLTGRRLVSLPFSDYCQPLVRSEEDLVALLAVAKHDAEQERLKYIEIRPVISDESCIRETTHLGRSTSVVVHKVDLRHSEEDLLKSFHKNCIRKKLSRTQRGQLRYEEGRSEELLATFYKLQLVTRRRHQLPPQPFIWFKNLLDCLGEKLQIRVVLKNDTPIASIMTLSFKGVILDKYSCSDPNFKALGGTIFLLWRTIQEGRSSGLHELDLGRSEYNTSGLITFKERWGATRHPVNYYRYPAPVTTPSRDSRLTTVAKRILTVIPDSMFSALGGLLYRHAG